MPKAVKIPTAQELEAAAERETFSASELPRESGIAPFDVDAFLAAARQIKSGGVFKTYLESHASNLHKFDRTHAIFDRIKTIGDGIVAAEEAARRPLPVRCPFIVENTANIRIDGGMFTVPAGTKVNWYQYEVEQAIAQGVRLRPLDDPNQPDRVLARALFELDRARVMAFGGTDLIDWVGLSESARAPYLERAQREIDAQMKAAG